MSDLTLLTQSDKKWLKKQFKNTVQKHVLTERGAESVQGQLVFRIKMLSLINSGRKPKKRKKSNKRH